MHSGFPGGSDGKESAYNAGNLGLIPGLGRSPREGNGNPHLPGEIPRTEGPGGLQSMGLQRVGHDRATKSIHVLWNYFFPCSLSLFLLKFTLLQCPNLAWLFLAVSLELKAMLACGGCSFVTWMKTHPTSYHFLLEPEDSGLIFPWLHWSHHGEPHQMLIWPKCMVPQRDGSVILGFSLC